MTNENTFYSAPAATPSSGAATPVVVWGSGNMGRASIRAVLAHPDLALVGVIVHSPAKAGTDAGVLAEVDAATGVAATTDVAAALSLVTDAGAVVYAASGDTRPDEAAADVRRALASGATVVTPALYALYDPASAPAELVEPMRAAAHEGGAALFVSGIDPGWGNDVLPLLLSGLAGTVDEIRCQEIFDYSTYDQPDAVRFLVGMGEAMDYEPPMVAAGVPTMVWGGQVRLLARGLGVELDEIRETLDRRALDVDVHNAMGTFAAGTQGALRFEVQGIVAGQARIVVEHVTRIGPDVAPDWPRPADGAAGAHRVVIEGRPRLCVTVEASDEGGNRAAGGNATAAIRLVNAIPWLRAQPAGIYDALDVPLSPATGRLGRSH